MKFLKSTLLPLLSVGCGGLILSLRIILNRSRDELGLLPSGHICTILSYVLTVAFLAALLLCVLPLKPISSYKTLFPAGKRGAIGCALGAAGILYSGIPLLSEGGALGVILLLLAILSALALGNIALLRLSGRKPNAWLHMLPVVYLMIHAVLQVRHWSATVQVSGYLFPLMAGIFLMIAAYYQASLNLRKTGRRWFLFSSQAALFFCCAAAADNDAVFYLLMAGWMACDLCVLTEPRKREQPREEQA